MLMCGPVGIRSDIASKSGFLAGLFEYEGKLKRILRRNAEGMDKNSFESKIEITLFIGL